MQKLEIPCFLLFYFGWGLTFLLCFLSFQTVQDEITQIWDMTHTPTNPAIRFPIY